MLKKILMAAGVAFLLLIGLFVTFMVWGQRKGAELQDKFFAAVESDDPGSVIALMDPNLAKHFDAPVLGAWMKAVASDLGPYKGLRMSDFHFSTNVGSGGTRVESVGTVDFEKGSARSELAYLNGLLIAFKVRSPQIPENWFDGPVTTDLYREQGQKFLRAFLGDDPEAAFALMHADLQKKIPMEELKMKMAQATTEAGPLKSVEFQSESIDAAKGHELTVKYRVKCERHETTADVNFRFVGLKGWLIGYDLFPSAK